MLLDLSAKKLTAMIIGSLLISSVMAIRYTVGNVLGYTSLPGDLTITAPVMLAALIASLAGGWVISSAFSQHIDVRKKMASLLPLRLPMGRTIFGLFFFPVMTLASCGIASLLGVELEFPSGGDFLRWT